MLYFVCLFVYMLFNLEATLKMMSQPLIEGCVGVYKSVREGGLGGRSSVLDRSSSSPPATATASAPPPPSPPSPSSLGHSDVACGLLEIGERSGQRGLSAAAADGEPARAPEHGLLLAARAAAAAAADTTDTTTTTTAADAHAHRLHA